jgi:hypothetical protein
MALPSDRAVMPSAPSPAVSAVPVSIPSAMIKKLRDKAKDFERSAQAKRREARDLELRASEMYDAFISFDLLADKLEQDLASAMSARSDETGTGSVRQDASAVPQADAQ